MLATAWIHPGDSAYPPVLSSLFGNDAPSRIAVLGDLNILNQKLLALFCSVKCPGNLILQTYDLAQRLRQSGVTVIGGFHSPMEQECLTILLRGTQPVIVCPARSLSGMRIPAAYKPPLEQGRMLLLSPCTDTVRRATVETAMLRNRFVAAVAGAIFVAHAEPRSKTDVPGRCVSLSQIKCTGVPKPSCPRSLSRHALSGEWESSSGSLSPTPIGELDSGSRPE